MNSSKCYENYPSWIIALSNFVQIALYFIGAFVIYQIGFVWLAVYLLFILSLEIRLMKRSCVNCYYYGKFCAFGRGKLASIFFKRGDSQKFIQDKVTWKDILPDFLVFIIPMVVGCAILVSGFSWLILSAVVLLFLLGFVGNGIIRGSLACKYCKQREVGCPAERLFSKTK